MSATTKKRDIPPSEVVCLWLQTELTERVRLNPRYGQNAMAQSLGISASQLSRLISGSRPCSRRMFMKLQGALGPFDWDRYYPESRTNPISSSGEKKQEASAVAYRYIDDAAYSLIADWEHHAIRELVRLTAAPRTIDEIAADLKLPKAAATVAVRRLERLGLIAKLDDGSWSAKDDFVTNQPSLDRTRTSVAHRRHQESILKQALLALHTVPVSERDQSSVTMAIDATRIPEACRMIANFRRELCQFLEGGNVQDRVYQLSISLFPVSSLKPRSQK